MAVGINEDKINQVKVDLLTYIETINAISERLDTCSLAISSCIDGNGKQEIEKKLNSIIRQMPRVSSNINSYISILNKVVRVYHQQDRDVASKINQDTNNVLDNNSLDGYFDKRTN